MDPAPEDPYAGLYDLSEKCLRGLNWRLETFRPKHERMSLMAPGIFDDIHNFLNQLLSFLRPWDLFQWLRWRVFDPLMTFLRHNILDTLVSHLWSIKDSFLGWWSGTMSILRATIANLPLVLYNALVSLPGWLATHFRGIYEMVKNSISYDLWLLRQVWERMPSWVRDPIERAWQQITTHIRWLWEVFGAYFNNLKVGVQSSIGILSTLIHNPLETLRILWQQFVQSWEGGLLRSWLGGLQSLINTVIEALRRWWAGIQPQIIRAAESAITFARPYIERWVGAFQELPATYLNWIAATAGTNLALTPSRALTTAGSLYAMSIAAGSLAMVTSTALNLIPATNWVGASQFSAFIAEAAGFEPLTRATYGVLLNEVLTQPLRYHWNYQLRPRIPTEGTIFLMGRKRGLTRSEFTQAMGYQGIPNWWIDKEYLFFWTDPSPYWLLRMSEAANPTIHPSGQFEEWLNQWLPNWRSDPWAWYKMKLMLAGFEDTDIPAFIEGFQKRMLTSAVTQVKTSVRAMLRDDYWTKADAQGSLRSLGTRQEEIELMWVAERLDYQHEYLDDQVMYYKESFRKGEIGEQDLSLALSTIYQSPERVHQEVARERVRALKKPAPITPVSEDPLVKSLRRQASNSWIQLYRDWEIDERDLLLGLTIVVQDPALAEEMVKAEKTRVRAAPEEPAYPAEAPPAAKARRDSIASWVAAYREGEITADELDHNLEPLIPNVETRREVVRLELLRYTPPPAEPVPPEEAPLAAQSRRQAIASWISAFRAGEFGPEELELKLTPLIPDRDTRLQVVELEQLRYVPTPELIPPPSEDEAMAKIRQEAVRGHIEMFQKRLIGTDELYIYLLGDGLVEQVARDTVITQATRRVKVPALDSPYFLQDVMRGLIDQGLLAFEEMVIEGTITLDQYVAWLTGLSVDGDVITYLADTLTLRRFLEGL